MLLCDAKKGVGYTVVKVNLTGGALRRAEELGVKAGGKISLKRRYLSGGGIFVVDGIAVAMGRSAARAVEVKK